MRFSSTFSHENGKCYISREALQKSLKQQIFSFFPKRTGRGRELFWLGTVWNSIMIMLDQGHTKFWAPFKQGKNPTHCKGQTSFRLEPQSQLDSLHVDIFKHIFQGTRIQQGVQEVFLRSHLPPGSVEFSVCATLMHTNLLWTCKMNLWKSLNLIWWASNSAARKWCSETVAKTRSHVAAPSSSTPQRQRPLFWRGKGAEHDWHRGALPPTRMAQAKTVWCVSLRFGKERSSPSAMPSGGLDGNRFGCGVLHGTREMLSGLAEIHYRSCISMETCRSITIVNFFIGNIWNLKTFKNIEIREKNSWK